MIKELNTPQNSVDLQGKNALDTLLYIISQKKEIEKINFWAYNGDSPQQIEEQGSNQIWLSRNEFLYSEKLSAIIKKLPLESELGVSSKVLLTSGVSAHLPMMDFRIPRRQDTLSLVIRRLIDVKIYNGWVLNSGASYHFYGLDLLNLDEWQVFMGKCLLTSIRKNKRDFQQIADFRYIGHSLIRGSNILRITANSNNKHLPIVLAKI